MITLEGYWFLWLIYFVIISIYLFLNEEKYRIHFFRTCSSSFSALIPPEQLADPSQLLFFCINLARATGGSTWMVGMGYLTNGSGGTPCMKKSLFVMAGYLNPLLVLARCLKKKTPSGICLQTNPLREKVCKTTPLTSFCHAWMRKLILLFVNHWSCYVHT